MVTEIKPFKCPHPPKFALFGQNLEGKVSEIMQIKGCRFTCIKLAKGHDSTVNLKKIDQAVSKLEHQLGLAERHLGLAPGYVPKVLDQCHCT